jgi:hypothetical protein
VRDSKARPTSQRRPAPADQPSLRGAAAGTAGLWDTRASRCDPTANASPACVGSRTHTGNPKAPAKVRHTGVHSNHQVHTGAQRCGIVHRVQIFTEVRHAAGLHRSLIGRAYFFLKADVIDAVGKALRNCAKAPGCAMVSPVGRAAAPHQTAHGDGFWVPIAPARPTPWRGCAAEIRNRAWHRVTASFRSQWAGS